MNIRAVIRQRLRQAQSRRMCVLARNNNESALLHRLTVQGITCRPYPGMYAEKIILEWSGRNRTIPTYMQNAGPTSSQHDFQLALRGGIMETRPFNRFAQQRHHLHRLYVRKGWKLLQSNQTRTYGIKISGPSRKSGWRQVNRHIPHSF